MRKTCNDYTQKNDKEVKNTDTKRQQTMKKESRIKTRNNGSTKQPENN